MLQAMKDADPLAGLNVNPCEPPVPLFPPIVKAATDPVVPVKLDIAPKPIALLLAPEPPPPEKNNRELATEDASPKLAEEPEEIVPTVVPPLPVVKSNVQLVLPEKSMAPGLLEYCKPVTETPR
jgi:hypothetical protein